MGLFSNLFGKKEGEKELNELLAHIRKLLDDESFQNELVPQIKPLLEAGLACDQIPGATGPFGFVETNPIPVNGSIGELAYLSRLETTSGERILFHRIGAIGKLDVYEAVTFSGSSWFVFFLDLYHPRRSRKAPDGFRVMSDPGQFSGFNGACAEFPYDFAECKIGQRESGLSMAYIALNRIQRQIESRAYERPVSHTMKLDILGARLTSGMKAGPTRGESSDEGSSDTVFIDRATAERAFSVSSGGNSLTLDGTFLTTLLLVAVQAGWRAPAGMTSDAGETIRVHLPSGTGVRLDAGQAQALCQAIKGVMKGDLAGEEKVMMDRLFRVLGAGTVEIRPA